MSTTVIRVLGAAGGDYLLSRTTVKYISGMIFGLYINPLL